MSRTTPRLVTAPLALLLATLLLVLGVAGGATAAKLITGKQIKNGTVASADLKNGSASGVDVRNGSLTSADVRDTSLTGADLAPGSIGADRLAPAARNDVLTQVGDDLNIGTCVDAGLDSCGALASTTLTAGTWLVVGTVSADNFNGPAIDITNRCGLLRGDLAVTDARIPLAANGEPGESMSLALQQVVVATGSTPVSLRCTEFVGESIRVNNPTITAVRVR